MNYNILTARNKQFSLHNRELNVMHFCISVEGKHLIKKTGLIWGHAGYRHERRGSVLCRTSGHSHYIAVLRMCDHMDSADTQEFRCLWRTSPHFTFHSFALLLFFSFEMAVISAFKVLLTMWKCILLEIVFASNEEPNLPEQGLFKWGRMK